MSPSTPFVDGTTGELDTNQILAEAVPLAKLIGLFVGLAIVPFTFAFLAGRNEALSAIFALLGQFVLAVGSGVVLIHVVVRAMRIADE